MRYEVTLLTADGLGFGDGSIGTTERIKQGELTPSGLQKAINIIAKCDDVFVRISPEITDDGCGDGRPAIDVWTTTGAGHEIHYHKSCPRAKIFGGGLVVAASMWRAIAGEPVAYRTILGDRAFIADKLAERGIKYGGHTDEQARGDACGCGAIDRYPDVSKSIITYREQIKKALRALYGNGYVTAQSSVDTVFVAYTELVDGSHYVSDAAGNKTIELMEREGAVIKRLGGGHREGMIVLNDVKGTTLDQTKLAEALKADGVEEAIQAFIVDVWRGQMYAEAVADIARQVGVGSSREELVQVAYADFLIRTLAVVATLTAGDLPVLVRTNESDSTTLHAPSCNRDVSVYI